MNLELLTAKEICGLLKISAPTLWRWVKAGRFPPPLAIGLNCTRWPQDKVREWMDSTRDNTRDNNVAALEGNAVQPDATEKPSQENGLSADDATA